jgi:O-antigen ligase/tetratricopeptide (TPR) repeat protein
VIAGGFSRAELARALGLGEFLVLAALVVLAPVVRGETAYGSVHAFLPATLAGDSYFLIMLAFLAGLILARSLAAGRLTLPEPGALAALAAVTLYVALRGRFSDHPYEADREAAAWLANLLLFALVLCSSDLGRWRSIMAAAAVAALAVQGFQAAYQYHVSLPEIRRMVEAGILEPGVDMQNPAAVSRMLSGEPFSTFLTANSLGGWMAFTLLAAAGLLAGSAAAARRAPAERRGLLAGLCALAAAGLALAGMCASLAVPGFLARQIGPAEHAGLVAGAAACLGLALWAGRGAVRLGPAVPLLAWLAPGALGLYAFALTGSKGAYVALAAAVPLALVAAPPVDGRAARALRWAAGAALAAMLAAALLWWQVPKLPGRSGLAASIDVRLDYWRPAAEMARSRPLFGVGPGKFGAVYLQLKGPMAEETKSAHSAYMETAAEQGLAGLALLLAFWGWCAWRLARRAPLPAGPEGGLTEGAAEEAGGRAELRKRLVIAGAMGALTSAAAGRMVLHEASAPALATLGLVWAAAFALAAWPLAAADVDARARAERWLGWGLLAALGAFLVHSAGCMSMNMRSVAGPALILAALGLAGPGRRELGLSGRRLLPAALALAAALAAAGWLGTREWTRAAALADAEAAAAPALPGEEDPGPAERSRRVVAALDRALELDPLNWPLHQHAGQACVGAAQRAADPAARTDWLDRAGRHYARAAELAPQSSAALRPLARFHVFRHEPEAARAACREYERLHRLYPGKTEFLVEWGDAELLAGDGARAVELWGRALEASRRLGDEGVHLSILFENYNRMKWQSFALEALAGQLDALLAGERPPAAALFRRALLEVARERFDAALPLLERAARAEPDDAQLLLFRGYGERLAGQWQKALETFAAAGKLEQAAGRPAGPDAVRRAVDRTRLARELERKRGAAAREPAER